MKAKLKDYIDTIFTDAPRTYRAYELKEEMYTDLCEKYDDLIAEGKTPASAYHAVISGVGDISELIEDLKKEAPGYSAEPKTEQKTEKSEVPKTDRFYTAEEQEIIRKYRNRGAIFTAISVSLYILCWLPLVLLSVLAGNTGAIVGLAVMFIMIAVATSLFIIHGSTKPACMTKAGRSHRDGGDDDDEAEEPRNPVYKAISGALWCLTVVVYLGVSFLTQAWTFTWLIFLIATAVDGIIKACFDLKS